MIIPRKLICCALILLAAACRPKKGADVSDRWIYPAERVGAITPESTEQELIRIYGEERLSRLSISLGEGEYEEGSVLFSGQDDEVLIEWGEEFRNPVRLTLTGSAWKTEHGICAVSYTHLRAHET